MGIALDLDFSITPQQINLDLGTVAQVTEIETVVEKDHANLENRDLPDQHPIGAITDLSKELSTMNGGIDALSKELEKKISATDVLSNVEIEQILQS